MTKIFQRRLTIIIFFISLLWLSSSTVSAEKFKGKVSDATSKEDLIGAIVTLTSQTKKIGDVTGLDGTFYFKDVARGTYLVTVSYLGYQTYSQEVEINAPEKIFSIGLIPESRSLSEVVVKGVLDKESDQFARRSELNASNVVNIISAKTIEISPDITLGNVLQRVSGVSMARSGSGDGQYAIIRGLPNRYTYTSLNGVILPSPDAQTRSIPLDMFPANMMERVEIVKSLTPNVEGNAIGGAANLVLKDAPDKLTINGTLSTGMNTVLANRSFSGFNSSGINFRSPSEIHGSNYAAKPSDFSVSQLNFNKVSAPLNFVSNFSIGNRFYKSKFGYLFGGSYIREYRASSTLLYIGQSVITNPGTVTTPNDSEYTAIQNREYSYLQSRLGLQGKLDYRISENHSLKLYGLFLQLDDNQHRHMVQNGLSSGGEIDTYERVIFTRKNIANVALSGIHKISKSLSADWTTSYAEASSRIPDWVDYGVYQNPGSEIIYASNPLTRQWVRSNDKDKSGYLNLKYAPRDGIEFAVGGMFRSKTRGAFYNQYRENTTISGGATQEFSTINDVIFSFNPRQNAYADSTNALNYSGTETVSALYAQAKVTLFKKLEALGGVREEITNQNYNSQIPPTLPYKNGSFNYVDLLPSLNLKYKLKERQNLRLSYFSGISRPNLYELVPSNLGGDVYSASGNPLLKHTTSQNIDFRFEHFFSTSNYIIAGTFYKNLVDPIEVSFDAGGGMAPTNPTNPVKDYGFEFIFSKFIRNFGLSGNYTYIHSAITTRKLIQERDANGTTVGVLVNQTRPMQGQANHIGNLSLLYKDAKAGLNIQLSYVYTGARISVVSNYYGLDQWQRANSQVDFSINKVVRSRFTIFVKATNLLNTNIYQDILTKNIRYQNSYPENSNPNRILVQKDVFRQTILAGLRFTL